MCIDVGRGERMKEGRWWVGGGGGGDRFVCRIWEGGVWVDGSGCSVGCSVGCICMYSGCREVCLVGLWFVGLESGMQEIDRERRLDVMLSAAEAGVG